MNTSTTATFKITITAFTPALSRVPRTNNSDMHTTMNTAGKLMMPPRRDRP
jgi:hypothetical protein